MEHVCIKSRFFYPEIWQVCQLSQTSGQQNRSVYHFQNKLGAFIMAFLLEGTLFPAAVELLFSYALTMKCRAIFIIATEAIQMEDVGV